MEFPSGWFVLSPHNQARLSTCLFCFRVISRADWRSPNDRHVQCIGLSRALASHVNQRLPDFRNEEEWMPASMCPTCRRWWKSVDVTAAKQRLADAAAQQAAKECAKGDGRLCDLCLKVHVGTTPVDVKAAKAAQEAEEAARAAKRKASTELSPGLQEKKYKSKSYRVRTRRNDPPPVQFDERDVISEYRRVPGVSARGVAKFAEVFAENHAEDIANNRLQVISPTKARRLVTKFNTVFDGDFESKTCPFTRESDGGAVMCRDAKAFMLKLVWIVCRSPDDVLIIRIYADSGKGSFKLLFSFVFNDDPLVNPDAPEGARALHAARKEGVKDTGVLRVYCLGLLEGAQESHDSVRWLFDSHDSLCSLTDAFPHAMICLALDGKMQNKTMGLMDAGCRFPEVRTHWSPWEQHSKPHEERTVTSVIADYEAREAARREGRNDDPKLFHSVVAKPIKLLQSLAHQPTMVSLPVAQLHETLGEASSVVGFMQDLSSRHARQWLREMGVRPSDRHGRTSFDGKAARALFNAKSIDILRRLIAEIRLRAKGSFDLDFFFGEKSRFTGLFLQVAKSSLSF